MFNMKNKITYKDLADKLNDLYYVYLDEAPPHLSMYPNDFTEERMKLVSRHNFAQTWLLEENDWTEEEYAAEFERCFQNIG